MGEDIEDGGFPDVRETNETHLEGVGWSAEEDNFFWSGFLLCRHIINI